MFETEMLQDEEIFTLFEEKNTGHFLGLPSEVWQGILGHLSFQQVHVPNFGGLSGSEDKGGGDNSIQFINFGRVGDKSFKEW